MVLDVPFQQYHQQQQQQLQQQQGASDQAPAVELIYPKCKKLEPSDMADPDGVATRALAAVRASVQQQQSFAVADPLPAEVIRRNELMGWLDALRALHAPASIAEHQLARQRVAFQVRRWSPWGPGGAAGGCLRCCCIGPRPSPKLIVFHMRHTTQNNRRRCSWASSPPCWSAAA